MVLSKVKKVFDGVDEARIGELCFELGCRHAEENYGEFSAVMIRDKAYWNWWRSVFDTNTKKILNIVKNKGYKSNVPARFFDDLHASLMNQYYISDDMRKKLFDNNKAGKVCQD